MLDFSKFFFKFISLILGIAPSNNFPPPLTLQEEERLFEKMHLGDTAARATIIEHNMRLVSHIIRKYYGSYESSDELLSIGSLGLIKAVDTYKCNHGTRFATYGAKCIQNEILMFFRSKKKCSSEVSINETIDIDKDGNPLTYIDIISVDESMAERIELETHIDRVRLLVETVLSEREKEIIVLRYGLSGNAPLTQREVAVMLGISRSYVSRIEKKALDKLKNEFGSDIPSFDF